MRELSPDEMDKVAGGKRHFKPFPDKPGWIQHKVSPTDTLIRIADMYDIKDWRFILKWNPHIDDHTCLICTGEYLWIKK
ncbi:MAG: LysM peptidoglycan-binding domain-containing protein [Clostridia bacterium]|nr:LysM peptidoglycan-binding domain-containing protein [Clostridia bacterium]